MKITEHIRGTVVFQYYRDKMLFYKTSDTDLLFSVPIEDTDKGVFLREDKSITFMRYIRKHLESVHS